jgi:hypothetical protein
MIPMTASLSQICHSLSQICDRFGPEQVQAGCKGGVCHRSVTLLSQPFVTRFGGQKGLKNKEIYTLSTSLSHLSHIPSRKPAYTRVWGGMANSVTSGWMMGKVSSWAIYTEINRYFQAEERRRGPRERSAILSLFVWREKAALGATGRRRRRVGQPYAGGGWDATGANVGDGGVGGGRQ